MFCLQGVTSNYFKINTHFWLFGFGEWIFPSQRDEANPVNNALRRWELDGCNWKGLGASGGNGID